MATRGTAAVLVAGVAAQLSVSTVGALPWFVLPLSATAYIAGGMAADRAEGRRSDALRRGGMAVVLIGLVFLGPRVIGGGDRIAIKQDLGSLLIIAQVGQALGWRALRDVRSGLMASFGLLVLSASYAPDMLIGFPMLVGWVAVVLGLALLGGVGRIDATRAAAVAVAVGLAAFLVIPVDPTQGARARLGQLSGARSVTRLPTDAFSTDRLDLRQRGTLPTTGILHVPEHSPQLWRAITFDDYDGVSWTRDSTGRQLTVPGPPYQVSAPDGPVRSDVVERLAGGDRSDGTVWSPGRVVSVGGLSTPVVDPDGDVRVSPGTTSYSVTSAEPVADATRLRSLTGADAADRRWRALPAGLPSRVARLARQVTARGVSRYDKAELIAAYLRTSFTYTLDSPVPLPGQDAVDRFLFVDRSGFCEQFASAQVVMLRTLGIPARLVTGLAYGVGDHGLRLFRVSDLHAWAELWVPGVGWVSTDPTAGVPSATVAATQDSLRQRASSALRRALATLTRLPGGRPALALLLVAVALLGNLTLTRRARRVQAGPPALPAGPALQAFLRLDERMGEQRRREAESLSQLAHRLDPGLRDALNVVERECYAPVRPAAGEVSAAVAVMDRASAPDSAGHRAPPEPQAGRGRRARRG